MFGSRIHFLVWLGLVAVFAALVMQPIGADGQITLGVVLLTAMAALWASGRSRLKRMVFITIASTVVLRYVYWRSTSTLPPVDDLMNFIPGVLLYAMEMFTVTMLFVSLFVVADPIERATPPAQPDQDLPTVDVFVPTYDEDETLLATTLAAARGMDYPADKLRIYLLDDGGTDQKCQSADPVAAHAAGERRRTLMELCRNLDVTYLTRQRNEHAKAGNMNAALPRTTGELIAIFDADHAPVREFLRTTVGHFAEDPRLFLVQTPHFFLNPDPIERNLATFNRMPSENEMFYGLIQKGLDKWNAAFFCGSAALLRREPLEEAGGFDGVSITEDCETALSLHSRGWNSRYIDTPLIAGLQPETFSSFIGQRSRWCSGMMQILLLKNPLFRPGLKLAQRISYLSSSLFWLFPLTRLTFVAAPLLFIFFSMEIYRANLSEFVAYTAVYLAASLMMQNYLYGSVRWPWISELYEYVQSVFLIRSIVGVVLSPRKPTFKVTAKRQTVDSEQLSELAFPYFAIFAVLFAAMVVVGWRWAHEPAAADMLAMVGAWNLFNLVIAGLALGVVCERQERRISQRLAINRRGALMLAGTSYQVLIEDVSMGGIKIRPLGGRIPVDRVGGRMGTLAVAPSDATRGIATLNVEIRRVQSDDRGMTIGLAFLNVTNVQYRIVADLMYATGEPLAAFRDRRRGHVGLFTATPRLLAWSGRQILRGLSAIGRSTPDKEAAPIEARPAPVPPRSMVISDVESPAQ